MEDIVIRGYKREDRQFVRNIAWETAFMGEPASVFFSDKEISSDFLTLYFTDYEPESCFVAESEGSVIGYLIGSKNEACLKKVSFFKIMPKLFLKIAFRRVLCNKKSRIYLTNCLLSFLKGEFNDPDFSLEYPAVLHINIKKGFRKSGIGSRLISAFVDYIGMSKIKGIHLSTMSTEAGDFFKANGFDLIYTTARSYFKHILNKNITAYVYAKKNSSFCA